MSLRGVGEGTEIGQIFDQFVLPMLLLTHKAAGLGTLSVVSCHTMVNRLRSRPGDDDGSAVTCSHEAKAPRMSSFLIPSTVTTPKVMELSPDTGPMCFRVASMMAAFTTFLSLTTSPGLSSLAAGPVVQSVRDGVAGGEPMALSGAAAMNAA